MELRDLATRRIYIGRMELIDLNCQEGPGCGRMELINLNCQEGPGCGQNGVN